MGDHSGYSDQMARRIHCLQIGSFDCLIRGGVFDEIEARAIVPYLDVRLSRDGYCIAYARATRERAEISWFHEEEEHPADSAERAIRVRLGRNGFVYRRHEEDDLVLLYSSVRESGHATICEMLEKAAADLASRHQIVLEYAVGGWRTDLVDAHASFGEATSAFARGESLPFSDGVDDGAWAGTYADDQADGSHLCANEPVRSIQEYILEHFSDPKLALRSIAAQFGLTETYLSQLFKEQTGLNYSAFLEEHRIEQARHLLERSELSVSQVAGRVGYQTNSTFYRAFRRIHGASPTAYRGTIRRNGTPARPERHRIAV